MFHRKRISGICLCMLFCASLFAQTHSSVSLENQVYYILEQAELRGLCTPLSGVRPYTQSVVSSRIKEILNSENAGKLKSTEREILNQYLGKFSKPKTGLDWQRGSFYSETSAGKNDTLFTANAGFTADLEGSFGIYPPDDFYSGTELWLGLFLNGDLGSNVSYDLSFEAGLVKAPRTYLGTYPPYYKGYNRDETSEFLNEEFEVYSEPLTHFPYTYKKRWDSSVFYFSNLEHYNTWPEDIAVGYNIPAELTASFLENKFLLRLGRISRDWSSTSLGSSLVFNQMARPFLALETEFNPVPWLGYASLTGFLEYYNTGGTADSAMTYQNAFSINMLQFRYKNYLYFDIVDAVVWPKRFELGYLSPVTINYFYQNNAGNVDNMAIALNLKAQYPGIGSIWFSMFVDEMNITEDWFTLDRQMFAVQAGIKFPLPFLSFSSIKMSYTKVNPYCYTHPRIRTPWNGDLLMETAYSNNGVGLGYYLPPNADEILVRYETMPVSNVRAHLQYQLIRHGADFGLSSVDGSNLQSELDYPGINSNQSELKRFFLRDGAYQWYHIIKTGVEWDIPRLPISLFGEAGMVISYFTNIDGEANSGEPSSYSRINTSEYPEQQSFIIKLGFKVFPRN